MSAALYHALAGASPPRSNQPALNSPLFLGIDASTRAIRAIVFDSEGNALASGRGALSVVEVPPGGYEQDPEEWWTAFCVAVQHAVSCLEPGSAKRIRALAIAHQRETIALTDAAGTPLGPALLWMDGRSTAEVRKAERTIGAVRLHGLSGKPPCTSPSLYKLMHMMASRPEVLDVAIAHDVHSLLTKRLTGRGVSAFPSADAWGMVDMRKRAWSPTLMGLVGLELHQLPELLDPGAPVGTLRPSVAAELGLPEGTLVCAGAGDAQASGLGAGVIQPKRCFLDLGTAVTAGVLSEKYEINLAFRTLYAATPGLFCLETNLRGGMQTLFWWLEQQLGRTDRRAALEELEREAKSLRPGSDALIVLPYWAGVTNPYWDDSARGSMIGLAPHHRAAHVFRAIQEGIAFEVRTHLDGIESYAGKIDREVIALGGGSRSALWCQILADVLGRAVRRSESAEAAALGAAVLAAVGSGAFESQTQATESMTRLGETYEPGPGVATYERLYRDVYRGLYSDLANRLRALAPFRNLSDS